MDLRLFLLGATGYIGSQFLFDLARSGTAKKFHIRALVRASPEKEARLKEICSSLQVVHGDLQDENLIQEEASKADIVINCATSSDWPSIRSILTGLEKRSSENAGNPPLYIHTSGIAIISDNCRGEAVEFKEYTDIGFKLEDLPETNVHLDCDLAIVQAGTRKENPVRTIMLFPGWVYGVGEGIQKITFPYRTLLGLASNVGFAGTWGKGFNGTSNVHVKDVSSAILVLLDSALDGKVGTVGAGADDLYFVTSTEKVILYHELMTKFGDILHREGVVKSPGSRPYPDEVLAPLGEAGWSALGGNERASSDRLANLGWEPVETRRKPLLESLPEEIEVILQEMKAKA
ncbi:hypothetical protein VNI00_015414 [Paramarasmius palmivorus]|uniref:NmrA-like domain-containing protein n=1 Tax=Paramarasmius palmivorus TaxID=297713 RepID=A0AAW0BJR7_9AGAR